MRTIGHPHFTAEENAAGCGLGTTFCTHLCAAGVPLRTAQAAMRHSKPELTANIYTDPRLLDVAGAVASLPALAPEPVAAPDAAVVAE